VQRTGVQGKSTPTHSSHHVLIIHREKLYHRRLLLRQPKPTMKFGTLLRIPQGLSSEEVNHNRRVCLLAEAIYCSILGGYMPRVSYELGNTYPFGFPTLSLIGTVPVYIHVSRKGNVTTGLLAMLPSMKSFRQLVRRRLKTVSFE
jgi:hypothetical protein